MNMESKTSVKLCCSIVTILRSSESYQQALAEGEQCCHSYVLHSYVLHTYPEAFVVLEVYHFPIYGDHCWRVADPIERQFLKGHLR